MSKILIGQSENKNASLDLDILLRTHLLIWASTGGGKSYLIRRIVEQACKKIPIIIVDREGEFATLRDKFDFVLVGPGGETPADPRSAKMVAEKLLELGASAVCDLFEMKVETRHQWVKNFYEALVNAPKRLWSPAVIILDEAHSFAPEKGQGESPAYGAVTDFSGVARKRGFGSIFATQRLSKLSKNATAEMYNQAAGPTASQADRDRAAYEMGISGKAAVTEFSNTLRTLEPGNFFFQGRAISIDRILVKVGPAETAHEAGKHLSGHVAKAPPIPENIKALLPKLADLPKMAEEEAKTVAELRTEIRSLKTQLRTQPAVAKQVPVVDQRTIDRAVAPLRKALEETMKILVKVTALKPGGAEFSDKELQKTLEIISKDIRKLAKEKLESRALELERLQREIGQLIKTVQRLTSKEPISIDVTVAPPPLIIHRNLGKPENAPHHLVNQTNGDLQGPHKKILKALGELLSIGREQAPKPMVAAWAGYSPGGGAFMNPLGYLRTAGLVHYPQPGSVALTDAGREHVGPCEPPDQDEIHRRVRDVLPGPARKILSVLLELPPGTELSKEQLAEQAGYTEGGGAFQNPLGALRTAGFVDYPRSGYVRASDWLFL